MPERTEYREGEFCWVDLVAKDLKAATKFYEEVFGWKAKPLTAEGGPPYVQFELNGKGIAGGGELNAEMEKQGIPPMWNSYINVASVEEVAAKAVELGGQITMPPMQVFDAGWLAFIQDPTGGNVGLWQRNQHFGAELVNDPGAFCWNELATREIEKAKDFYGKLLGWEFAENSGTPSKYYIIKCQGNDNGGIMQMTAEWGDIPPCWGVYFTTMNLTESLDKLTTAGGKVMVPAFDTPVGPMSVVADSQGAVFSLIQIAVG